MGQYFPKPNKPWRDINVKVDSSNYSTKADFKIAAGVDTLKFVKKVDLASLKSNVDKLDFDKLKTVPIDLSKLSNVVKNEVVKKTVYDKLVTKVNNIDTCEFVLKTKCDTNKSDLEKKINDANKKNPATSGLVKKNKKKQKNRL